LVSNLGPWSNGSCHLRAIELIRGGGFEHYSNPPGIALMADRIFAWLDSLSLPLLGLVLLSGAFLAAGAGFVLRIRKRRLAGSVDSLEGSIVSAILGLLALLLAFTFSLTIDRFETRRHLVISHSNTIGTAFLRAQLLPEPHRARLCGLLLDYTRNLLSLARARREDLPDLLARDDRLLGDIWSATGAAYDATKTFPFSIGLLDSVNAMIDADAARRGERLARIPGRVLVSLFLYLVITAAVLGYLLTGKGARIAASILMGLLVISLLLIIDIDQPTRDSIVESQSSIEAVLETIENQPPGSYDRWRRAD